MKTLTVTFGDRKDPDVVVVELPGVDADEPLKPKMARMAARIGAGHEFGVKVTEVDGTGYHICSPASQVRNSFYKIPRQ